MALSIDSSAIHLERPKRTARWLAVTSIASLGGAAALIALGAAGGMPGVTTMGALGLVGGFTLAVAAVLNRFFMRPQTKPVGPARPGTVVVDGEGVCVTIAGDEEHRFDREAIKLGWIDGQGAVVLELHSGERLALANLAEDQRHRLLVALETASAERVMDTTIAGPYQSSQGCLRMVAAAAIPMVALGVLSAPCAMIPVVVKAAQGLAAGAWATSALTLGLTALFMGLLATAAFGMVRFYRPRQVRVGTDGVRISGTLGARLIRYGEIAEVRSQGNAVVLTSSQGGPDRVLVGAEPALAIRIRQAMEASRERKSSGTRIELLDQGTRSSEDWRSDLADLCRTAGRYRDRGLDTQQLAGVVEDPACSPRRRVAAAFALSHSADEPARRRIRIAAEACADDQLRLALEEAAAGELAERRLQRCCYDP